MKNQKDINCRMRAIIVNWIIEVHDRFKLLPDTLFLSIIIFDRYMSIINNNHTHNIFHQFEIQLLKFQNILKK